MENYMMKYLTRIETQKKSHLNEYDFLPRTPQPTSFLERLTPKKSKPVFTATEEIYDEEIYKFYNNAKKVSSLSPVAKKSKFDIRNSPDLNASIFSNRISRKTKPSGFEAKEAEFSYVTPKTENMLDINNNKIRARENAERYSKINSIIKVCDVLVDTSAVSSTKLKNFIGRERVVAKQFTKEMKWTSEKLADINGHQKDLMKKLYEEYKCSYSLYEQEKTIIAGKYNTKSLRDYRCKAKNMKKFLSDFKLKIIP